MDRWPTTTQQRAQLLHELNELVDQERRAKINTGFKVGGVALTSVNDPRWEGTYYSHYTEAHITPTGVKSMGYHEAGAVDAADRAAGELHKLAHPYATRFVYEVTGWAPPGGEPPIPDDYGQWMSAFRPELDEYRQRLEEAISVGAPPTDVPSPVEAAPPLGPIAVGGGGGPYIAGTGQPLPPGGLAVHGGHRIAATFETDAGQRGDAFPIYVAADYAELGFFGKNIPELTVIVLDTERAGEPAVKLMDGTGPNVGWHVTVTAPDGRKWEKKKAIGEPGGIVAWDAFAR